MRSAKNLKLSPEIVLNAYYQGYFPMADERGTIGFYAYEPRGVIPLDECFKVRRSLKQIIRRHDYEVRYDSAPREVLQACARAQELDPCEVWLSQDLIAIYLELFQRQVLHTVEVWRRDAEGQEHLVGGLYGLTIGGAFCGESMFSREPCASQIALVYLVERLRRQGFELLDAQMSSEHLKQFGLRDLTQAEYLTIFHRAAKLDRSF